MRVIKSLGTKKENGKIRSYSLFICDYCEKEVIRMNQAKKQMSCGCVHRELHKIKMTKHGEGHDNKTKLYRVWSGMFDRCYRENNPSFHRYGGRGISVCSEWREYLVFKKFALENGYVEGLSIDRIDNDGNYEPTNIRFVPMKDNVRNRNATKLSKEKAMSIKEEYSKGGISQKALGEKYNVTQGCVGFILRGERWA